MKRLLFSSIVWLACINLSLATVRTVCNMAYTPGQYTTFAAALTASSPLDTIYVHGSSINYGAINVNKNGIVIIGAGHNPNKQVPLASSFTFITLTASNCQFIGLSFESLAAQTSAGPAIVRRCKLQVSNISSGILFILSPNADNWVIEGNVFAGSTTPSIGFNNQTSNNTIIRNNIFDAGIWSNSAATNPFSLQINHNIFLGSTASTFLSLNNATINDNIFYRSSPQGITTGTMNNNISFQCVTNAFSAPGINNLVNTNPMFTNFPLAGALFDYSHDYTLAAGSPGIATASDGTDRGVFGGFGSKFNMTGEPAMAEITAFTITSPTTIAPGGTLTISVTSTRIK